MSPGGWAASPGSDGLVMREAQDEPTYLTLTRGRWIPSTNRAVS